MKGSFFGSKPTGWRCFGGDYGAGWQIVPNPEKPELFLGEPTLDADGHIYEIWEGPEMLEFRLLATKTELAWVGAPESEVIFDWVQLNKNVRLQMKLRT